MPIEKTDALILKSFPYGDTSKIARCYTRDYGKISVIGKGVRTSKALQSGYLEPLNYLSLLFYYSPKRQLQIFSKAEFQAIWAPLKRDVKKVSYGFAVIELIDRAVTGEEPHDALFQLTVNVLQAINDTQGNVNILFWYFEVQALSLLGFRPVLSVCPRCHSPLEEGYFSLEYGELLCKTCHAAGEPHVSRRAMGILKQLKKGTLAELDQVSLEPGDRNEVGAFIRDYLRYHIEGLGDVKSLDILGQIVS